jgi:hypothetical protein
MKYAALFVLLFANAAWANGLDGLRTALGTGNGKPREILSTLVGSSSALRIDECVNYANRLVVLKRGEQGTARGLGSDAQYRNTYSFTPKA